MRNPHNAVTDTLEILRMTDAVVTVVRTDPIVPNRWIVRFESHENALPHSSCLEVEIIEENDGDATVCVLRRVNVGRRPMNRIMDTLVRRLDDDAPRLAQPSGQPPAEGAPAGLQH